MGRPMVSLVQPVPLNLVGRAGRHKGRDVEAQLILPIVDKIDRAYYNVGLAQPRLILSSLNYF